MSLRKSSFFICLIASLLCVSIGYGLAGKWSGVWITLTTGLLWMPARKYPESDLPFICLAGTICLAVGGIILDSPPLLMICGAGFALAAWDLVFLNGTYETNSSEEKTRRYEKKHIQTLAFATGCGLMTVYVGHLFNFRIPFVVMILFIALMIFGFEGIWVSSKKRR